MYDIDPTEPIARLVERVAQGFAFALDAIRRLRRQLEEVRDLPGYDARLIAVNATLITIAAMLSDLHQQERTAAIAEQMQQTEIVPTLEPQHEGR